ncbi:transcriptional regulator HdfR [compost metagenome]
MLNVGGEISLVNPLMLNWVTRLREQMPSHAVHAEVGEGKQLQKQLELGLLDAALVFRPDYWPGMQVEQLLEEKLVLVSVAERPEPYVYIDWGDEFRRQHNAAMPDKAKAAVSFNLGPLALQYLLECGGSGYFRTRVVHAYLRSGVLRRVDKAPEFIFPTYLVYSREKDSPALQQAIAILREVIAEDIDWSQRWDYEI